MTKSMTPAACCRVPSIGGLFSGRPEGGGEAQAETISNSGIGGGSNPSLSPDAQINIRVYLGIS